MYNQVSLGISGDIGFGKNAVDKKESKRYELFFYLLFYLSCFIKSLYY